VRKVEVQLYNDQWSAKFEEEAVHLQNVFGSEIQKIHHIGSTAVKGIQAKPIIDMMIEVYDIKRIDTYNAQMIAVGYKPKGENGIGKRRYFQKGGDNRTHHVHIFEIGSPNIERHLAFRDYLRSNGDIAKMYGDFKKRLSDSFPFDSNSYGKYKEPLIKVIERQALEWYRKMK
jgi:GrpB-like predicted nucleotidyltransferase (UPF0157 family)